MVYATPFPYLSIYFTVIISSRDGFVLGIRKSIIIDFMAIIQNIIYTLSSSFVNRSCTGIGSDCNLPPLLLLFAIYKHMHLNNFYDESNSPQNIVQHIVSKVLIFHENT